MNKDGSIGCLPLLICILSLYGNMALLLFHDRIFSFLCVIAVGFLIITKICYDISKCIIFVLKRIL